MRGLITDLLSDGGIPVVGEAANGKEAIEVVKDVEPDVVTMDLEMPELNGIEAVERLMAERPTPVLMLSAYTDDDAEVTFEALDKGAVDFFAKPGGEVSMGVSRMGEQLVSTVQTVADADIDRSILDREDRRARRSRPPESSKQTAFEHPHTVVIGSSTGGPNAVERVLESLPSGDCRVLVVQHMPEAFTARFADRLDAASEYDITEATDGARIGPGEGLVAQGGRHLTVSNYRRGRLRVKLIEDDRGYTVQPAVDVTMASAAETIDDPLIGVILTGMGADGADGIRAIHTAGGRTIAQSEDTCVIYGMPKRAVETGHVDDIRDLDEVSAAIAEGNA
ncbi:chemotaxis-specific protein-glutamate methyltransferase CheB [Halalkalirubrum salinum]|uniref:chemotaxis-specific protein-glutamate methyltransferase CheB n=1 Tax=Halalkalirubrum salinum TaxID=2563889 RepID=UPI0010FB1F6E